MGDWSFMIDPAWRPANEGDEPPIEAVIGGWFLRDDGEISLFRPNPNYQPSKPGLPTDPVDAALQSLVAADGDDGPTAGEELLSALRDVLLGVAVDEQGIALVAPAPDGVPSVLVATAPAHRTRVNTPGWRDVTVTELAASLPPEGVDVLINPGAPASTRLTADTVRLSVTDPAPGDGAGDAAPPAATS
ncbi:type VII secretion system-associated protein [Actinophytocola sp.]|uniref:type VII secretion system-associated protein n=1 Tax=Actinophytocola sp. TaxID=1872138 RepID=UPI002D662F1B|nr:type VII secretion system-associated protein [Actinophytocola sp.]HYQ66823.1 type VII secretion system-associated protein [Actinophytocola sp.]